MLQPFKFGNLRYSRLGNLRWSLDPFSWISGRRPASYQPRAIALGSLPIRAIAGQRPASPHLTIPRRHVRGSKNYGLNQRANNDAGRWPANPLRAMNPGRLPWAGMNDAFGVATVAHSEHVQSPGPGPPDPAHSKMSALSRGLPVAGSKTAGGIGGFHDMTGVRRARKFFYLMQQALLCLTPLRTVPLCASGFPATLRGPV